MREANVGVATLIPRPTPVFRFSHVSSHTMLAARILYTAESVGSYSESEDAIVGLHALSAIPNGALHSSPRSLQTYGRGLQKQHKNEAVRILSGILFC